MNIFGFNKPEPKCKRKTKASRKWINRESLSYYLESIFLSLTGANP
jgi:hypothetical protein